jgi:prevent-host-death family protein
MEKAVTAADANRKFSKLLKAVEGGDTFVVTSHGRPVAKLVPVETDLSEARRAKAALLKRLRSQRARSIGPWTRDELYEDIDEGRDRHKRSGVR